MKSVAIERLRVGPPLSTCFPIDHAKLARITNHMREFGYDQSEPIVVGIGNWPEAPIVVDGHTRLKAASAVGFTKLPVIEHKFPNAIEAVLYAIHRSQDRHNRDDAAIQRAIAAVDSVSKAGRPRKSEEKLPPSDGNSRAPTSATRTAEALGITTRKVERARAVEQHADLAEKVKTGQISINAAAQEAAKRDRAARTAHSTKKITAPREAYDLKAWMKLDPDTRAALIFEGGNGTRTATFNSQRSPDIDWAKWSWNPVTGCKHDCPYCYARDIAADLHKRGIYPFNFAPAFYPHMLSAPARTKVPDNRDPTYRNVFTCSMADLFGRWVPRDWIDAVFAQARQYPQWNFLFLTKFPQRYVELDIPTNAWVGTTIDCQARVSAAEDAFAKVTAQVKWLSIEPMLEPLQFQQLELFDWIVIGGASASTKTPEWRVPAEWWGPLHAEAIAKGIPVYHKSNLYERALATPMSGKIDRYHQAPRQFDYIKKKTAADIAAGEVA